MCGGYVVDTANAHLCPTNIYKLTYWFGFLSAKMSKKKQKANQFHEQMKNNEKRFENLGLQRPQDKFKDLVRRARQLNFGLINYNEHPTRDRILASNLTPTMTQVRNNWEIEPSKPFQWVRNSEDFQQFYSKVLTCTEIAVDVEVHSYRSHKGNLLT